MDGILYWIMICLAKTCPNFCPLLETSEKSLKWPSFVTVTMWSNKSWKNMIFWSFPSHYCQIAYNRMLCQPQHMLRRLSACPQRHTLVCPQKLANMNMIGTGWKTWCHMSHGHITHPSNESHTLLLSLPWLQFMERKPHSSPSWTRSTHSKYAGFPSCSKAMGEVLEKQWPSWSEQRNSSY